MEPTLPVYPLRAFPGHQPDSLFYMTRLEKLVQEFKGIDNPHSHTFYLVMWITQGSGSHTIDFRTYSIAAHQLYFLTPGQVHSWQLSADVQGYNLFFDAAFFQSRFGSRLYEYPFFHSHQHQPLLEVTDRQPLLRDLFNHAYDEYEGAGLNRTDVFLSFVHLILEAANRLYAARQTIGNPQLYDRLRQYEELLEAQFLTVRTVSAYAEQMNLTPNYLNYICKKIVGKTAGQLLHERLLIEAQRLLVHTTQSVKEIGFILGFDDPSYFVRFVKKYTGVTPAAFRQQQQRHR